VPPTAALEIQKTVYEGHSSGAGCPGAEFESGPNGTPVTYCFEVKNLGSTYLDDVTITDLDLGITRANLTLRSGTEPLAPGASLIFYYETTIVADLTNTAQTSGTPTDSGGTPIPNVPPPSDTDTASVGVGGDIINVCAHPCLSKLLIKRRGLDREQLQFAFLPTTPIDPVNEVFSLVVSNANGIVYQDTVPAGSFVQTRGENWIYRNRAAVVTGGFVQVKIARGVRNGNPDVIRVAIKAFGPLVDPTLADMTVKVTLGDDVFFATTTWDVLKTGGWVTWLPDGIP
jgi:hypothetical protein